MFPKWFWTSVPLLVRQSHQQSSPKMFSENVPQTVPKGVPQKCSQKRSAKYSRKCSRNCSRKCSQKCSRKCNRKFFDCSPCQMFPLPWGRGWVHFCRDFRSLHLCNILEWYLAKNHNFILNHLVATEPVKTKCEMQNCFMRVTTWHPMNYTVLHYLQ